MFLITETVLDDVQCIVEAKKNGSKEYEGDQEMMRYNSTATVSTDITATVYSSGTDYWEIHLYQNSGSTITTDAGNTDRFWGARLPIGDST